jgi:catechol 2,3-dioxygenase-like lactoylglutathione lyase family enzyme
MFAYAMLGTRDLQRAIAFYDPVMALLGQPRFSTEDQQASWGADEDYARPDLTVTLPFDGEPAHPGNGTMLAFAAPDPELVRALHRTALENGGTDEGAPGLRPHYSPGFYSAYVRDPDGNKLAFVCYRASETS